MSKTTSDEGELAPKDEDREHPVALAWRPTLTEIVSAFVRGDYGLTHGPHGCVSPVAPAAASDIESYIADYGETLVDLPEATWSTSVAQWVGVHWNVLVDLWTLESGRSDMVLDARVYETPDGGYRYDVHLVYVP